MSLVGKLRRIFHPEMRFKRAFLWRIWHPNDWICPLMYRVRDQNVGIYKRAFPLFWRRSGSLSVRDFDTVDFNAYLFHENVFLESFEGDKYVFTGVGHSDAEDLIEHLEGYLKPSKGVTLRMDKKRRKNEVQI